MKIEKRWQEHYLQNKIFKESFMKKVIIILLLFCTLTAYSQTWSEEYIDKWTVITKESWDRLMWQYKEDYGYCYLAYIDVLEMNSKRKVSSGTRPNFNGYYYLLGEGNSLAYGNSNTGRMEIFFGNYYDSIRVNSDEYTRQYNLYIGRVNRETTQPASSGTGSSQNAQYDSESDFEIERDTNVNGGVTITKYLGSKREVRIPLRIQNYPVTSIGGSAFANTSLTSVTIPNGVTSIGVNAFSDCVSLTSVTIPNSVINIEISAFFGCRSLASVTIGNSVTSIGDGAFAWCTSLTSVTIPNSVTRIGDRAFSDCANLTAINLANANSTYSSQDGVLYNKNKTFLHTYPAGRRVNSFTVPNSVTSIGVNAFSSCTSLTNVTIPNSVASIGDGAFAWCISLTSVMFQGTISLGNFSDNNPFPGDLRAKFYATNSNYGTSGMYTRPNGSSGTWTKQ
jgi:uncharacterized protein (UPF0248 family)